MNGVIFGTILIIFGAIFSWFTSMLLVSCAENTFGRSYEEFAGIAFGEFWEKMMGWVIIVTCLGFAISTTLFIKDMIP